jgi:hypothetical protein
MTEKSFDQMLQHKVTDLPGQMQPERDLWQGIDIALADRVSEQRASQQTSVKKNAGLDSAFDSINEWFSFKPMALAASMMLVAFLSWNSLNTTVPNTQSTHLVSQMMLQHEEQKSVLLASFAETPELTSNWQVQLQELEKAAKDIETALQNDPENITLLKMLQQVHQQQLELIETVHVPAWQSI